MRVIEINLSDKSFVKSALFSEKNLAISLDLEKYSVSLANALRKTFIHSYWNLLNSPVE